MRFEFCWQHRNCDKPCPVKESQSIFCWRIAHKESICHPDTCRRCSYRRNWFSDQYDLQEFITRYDEERGRRKARRILAIDDEENFLFALEETIWDLGFKCLTAIDGEEGFFFARETRPDLIITDVEMPGLNGYSLCRALKNDPKTAGIPVIIVSVGSTPNDRKAGIEAGAAAYLVKPLKPRDLAEQIHALLPPEPGEDSSPNGKP